MASHPRTRPSARTSLTRWSAWASWSATPTPGRQALSTTHDLDLHFAAGLVAEALVREAAASIGHRRLLLRSHFGVPPEEAFSALTARMEQGPTVTIREGRAPVEL